MKGGFPKSERLPFAKQKATSHDVKGKLFFSQKSIFTAHRPCQPGDIKKQAYDYQRSTGIKKISHSKPEDNYRNGNGITEALTGKPEGCEK